MRRDILPKWTRKHRFLPLNKKVKFFFVIFVFLALVDVSSTAFLTTVLSFDFEANPFARNIWGMFAIKAFVVGAFWWLVRGFDQRNFNYRFFVVGALMIGIVMQGFAGVVNLSQAVPLFKNVAGDADQVIRTESGDIVFIPDVDRPEERVVYSPLPKAQAFKLYFLLVFFMGLFPLFFAYGNLRVAQWVANGKRNNGVKK
jgi:hypothetical protein